MKTAYFALGIICVAIGLVGVFTPILPTTPFLILAAFCFSKSSTRFHEWLVNHPRLGPPVQDWRLYGAISSRAKTLGIIMLCLSGFYIAVRVIPPLLKLITFASLILIAIYIYTRPSVHK